MKRKNSDSRSNNASFELFKVLILHVVLGLSVFLQPDLYLFYTSMMYVILFISFSISGSGVDAGQDHWLRVLNKFTNIIIPLIGFFIILFTFIGILVVIIFGIAESINLLNNISLILIGIIVIVLAHTCPIMSGSILLFFRRS